MKILIGVDDSPHAQAALDFVRRMKWPDGTRAILVSAIRPPVTVYSEIQVPAALQTERILEDQIQYHQEIVSRAEKRLREAGLLTEARVLEGDPREVLVETARSEGVDLLVVGSHGRTGLAKLLMGSVASHVMGHASCNVLVAKLPADRP
jgi:universal stress protein A